MTPLKIVFPDLFLYFLWKAMKKANQQGDFPLLIASEFLNYWETLNEGRMK